MRSWTDALYDTCSLAILGRILLDHPEECATFASVWGIAESLSPARMRPLTAARLRSTIQLCGLPSVSELTRILARASFPPAVAEVNRLTYAAAVYHRHHVVTADKILAAALVKARLEVGNPDVVLKGLVQAGLLAAVAGIVE
jgi:hypothetical protein